MTMEAYYDDAKKRLEELIKDFNASITDGNEDYVTGVIYGLQIAKAALNAAEKSAALNK